MKTHETVHRYLSQSVGTLELRVSDIGVRSISFITHNSKPRPPAGHPVMERLVEELDSYFRGKLKVFTVPLDLGSGTDFQRRVWNELTCIPYGSTRSYGELAAAMGSPRAARAVGLANRCNEVPIVIPCHRVIRADGSLGGYASGTHIKRRLLELEGIKVC